MSTMQEYVKWRGDLSFEQVPVNEADEYIFACIGKPDYTGIISADTNPISLKEAVDRLFEAHPEEDYSLGLIASSYTLPLLKELKDSVRYSGLQLSSFINMIIPEHTEQFSALTVRYPGCRTYISFRGTDDSLVGWKENFKMGLENSVPSQRDACEYLCRAAELYDGDLVVSGHSKGGNLAVYAAVNAPSDVQDRIKAVYSYDGPGFPPEFFDCEGYRRIKDRIITLVPERSIVGMIMEYAGTLNAVKCETGGIHGHDALTWEVDRNGFVHAEELSSNSIVFKEAMDETMDELDLATRDKLIDGLFGLFDSMGVDNLIDFTENSLKKILDLGAGFAKEPEVRSFLLKMTEHTIRYRTRAALSRKRNERDASDDTDTLLPPSEMTVC